MKVVKQGKIPPKTEIVYCVTCVKCNSELEYTNADIKMVADEDHLTGHDTSMPYFTCGCCKLQQRHFTGGKVKKVVIG